MAKPKQSRRIRRLERRVKALESIIDTLPSSNVSDHIPWTPDAADLWAEQVDHYRHGGWENDDWNPTGYL